MRPTWLGKKSGEAVKWINQKSRSKRKFDSEVNVSELEEEKKKKNLFYNMVKILKELKCKITTVKEKYLMYQESVYFCIWLACL